MNKKAQAILEYSILVAVVIVVVVGYMIYVKRGLAGRWKSAGDQLGEQFTTARNYTIQTISQSIREETTGISNGSNNYTVWSSSQVALSASNLSNLSTQLIDLGIQTSSLTSNVSSAWQGYDYTAVDYVNATVGGGSIGSHATFDSGKLSNISLYDDD